MTLIGSPEWFNEKSHTAQMNEFNTMIENRREKFLDRFSIGALSLMTGKELLKDVFSDDSGSMMRCLMFDEDYRWFGAAGKYKYLGILYQGEGSTWKYKETSHPQMITELEAENRAEQLRDMLASCVSEIENIGVFETIKDYQILQERIQHIFFYKFPWAIKYYQMLFPQYFPGMYADGTLERALYILGLPDHGKSNRLINVGEISLFIRRCDINNIVFGDIYGKQWGWEKDCPSCEAAEENCKNSSKAISGVNTRFYKTSGTSVRRREYAEKAIEIEKEINTLQLEGKDREAIVKVRINQGEFRNRLLKKYDKCCLCGVKNPVLLVASHIKPWSVSEPEERLDENNGLLLCPNHDKLFDSGLISFDDEGKIIISSMLDETDQIFMNIRSDMAIKVGENQNNYLSYHRENVFETGVE